VAKFKNGRGFARINADKPLELYEAQGFPVRRVERAVNMLINVIRENPWLVSFYGRRGPVCHSGNGL
jgi:hypothetical protein